MKLKDKVALITGGGRGIGAAIVKRFAAEGAQIAFTCNQSQEAAKKLAEEMIQKGAKCKFYQVDFGEPTNVSNVVQDVLKEFGRLDILVNNAGMFERTVVGEMQYEDYEKIRRVNLDSVVALTNAAAKIMKAGSRIINISSVVGERAAISGASVYNITKFALTGASRSWAKDLGPKGILVNAVQPGPINTDMNQETARAADYMRSQTALGRFGQPEEVASVVAFLAGPDATYITGACFDVDGGWNA